jgi:integrase
MSQGIISDQNKAVVSKAGYAFDPNDDIWVLSRDVTFNVGWAYETLSEQLRESFLQNLRWYAKYKTDKYAENMHGRFKHFCKHAKVSKDITTVHILNYKGSLSKEKTYLMGNVRTFLNNWDELDIPGISQDVLDLMDEWKIKGNTTGEAVRNRCPIQGPLTKFELQSLFDGSVNAFSTGDLDLTDFALIRLFIATGRRPSQMSDLKASDLDKISSNDGKSHQYFLNIPRRKQRDTTWRGEFRLFSITHELGCLLDQLVEENQKQFIKVIRKKSIQNAKLIPMFPRWDYVEPIAVSSLVQLLDSDFYHKPSGAISTQFSTAANTKVKAYSERTQKRLHVSPIRLRRTKGTLAAKEGYGVIAIAEILDHSNSSHAHIYTENGPETAAMIDKAIAQQLAPFAQAFTGTLVTDPSEAPRGKDPTSVIRTKSSPVGNCGQFGYCGAYAPIACYTCQRFNPWLYAPHEEVLDSLLKDKEKVLKDTGDDTIASVNDRTILAVTQVIQKCEAKKKRLKG